jgi:hypothetical protein
MILMQKSNIVQCVFVCLRVSSCPPPSCTFVVQQHLELFFDNLHYLLVFAAHLELRIRFHH